MAIFDTKSFAAAGVARETAMLLGGWTDGRTAARYDHADRLPELREAIRRMEAGGRP